MFTRSAIQGNVVLQIARLFIPVGQFINVLSIDCEDISAHLSDCHKLIVDTSMSGNTKPINPPIFLAQVTQFVFCPDAEHHDIEYK